MSSKACVEKSRAHMCNGFVGLTSLNFVLDASDDLIFG